MKVKTHLSKSQDKTLQTLSRLLAADTADEVHVDIGEASSETSKVVVVEPAEHASTDTAAASPVIGGSH